MGNCRNSGGQEPEAEEVHWHRFRACRAVLQRLSGFASPCICTCIKLSIYLTREQLDESDCDVAVGQLLSGISNVIVKCHP